MKTIRQNGILAVWKPKGPTSHDLIYKIRKITGVKKVGHAGTLDPLAEGVLVIGIGRDATKKLKEIVVAEKEYVALIKLGAESSTDDEEGIKTEFSIIKKPVLAEIKKVIPVFIGKTEQVPPTFSAVKVNGRRAYTLARKGKNVELKPRPVEIKSIKILKYKWPFLKIKVVTGSGVYIRSLARDIGRKLNSGGYLAGLERIRVGQFSKKRTVKI